MRKLTSFGVPGGSNAAPHAITPAMCPFSAHCSATREPPEWPASVDARVVDGEARVSIAEHQVDRLLHGPSDRCASCSSPRPARPPLRPRRRSARRARAHARRVEAVQHGPRAIRRVVRGHEHPITLSGVARHLNLLQGRRVLRAQRGGAKQGREKAPVHVLRPIPLRLANGWRPFVCGRWLRAGSPASWRS